MLPICRFKYISHTCIFTYIQFDKEVVMYLPWTVLKIYQETSEKAKDIEKTLLRPLHRDPCLVKMKDLSVFFLGI